MKVAISDVRGEALSVALKMARDGHEVYHVSQSQAHQRVGLGLVMKAPSLISLMPSSVGIDLYAFLGGSMSGQGHLIRSQGKRVIGGNGWVDRLEDETFARSVADSSGIKMPESKMYPSIEEAIAAVRSDPRKYVINGRYASDIPLMLLSHISRQKPPIRVSEYVPGVEVYVETWYLDGINQFTITSVENRAFLDGEMGPTFEAQTCVCWTNQPKEPRVYQSVMKKLELLIEQARYTGPIGARLIISDKDRKPYLIGFRSGTPRHLNACRSALGFDLIGFLDGKKPEQNCYAYSALVSVPPYPTTNVSPVLAGMSRGFTILGHDNLALCDVESDPDGSNGVISAGTSGILGDVVGVGNSIELARQMAVKKLDDIVVEGKQARRGGGASRISRDVHRLAAMGYETPRVRAKEMVS